MVLYSDALSHRCTKLGNRDFVSKLAEIIDLFTVFSTFDMEKLGKILPHHKICKRLYGGGGDKFVPTTVQTSVKFRDFKEPYLH